MEMYLLKFSACLIVFWLVYIVLLEQHKMHQFKRFYLLGSIAMAIIIPLLTITYYIEPVVTDFEVSPVFIPIESMQDNSYIEEISFLNLENIIWSIYVIGVLIFSFKFVVNLFKLYSNISNSESISKHSLIYVLLKEYRIPHSFFKYIFLNKSKFENDEIPKEVLLHEETHAKQLHSIDIVLLELLQVIFWFHPLIYILKHHIKLNHEFLADQAVLEDGTNPKKYQSLLLQFSSNTQEYQLSSAINYSSFKKRFTVMKTQTSKTRIWLSSLLLLPVCAILFYSFAEREYVQKENNDSIDAITEELQEANRLNLTYVDGVSASATLMNEYKTFLKSYNETKVIYSERYERARIIYDEIMSDSQRASVEKYPERIIPEPNLSKTKPIKPTASQLESFKNSQEYAIWIDGKHVSNSTLNNYAANDFVHVTGSIVYKNARSEKFPQPNQYHLYTKAGFKSTYQDSQLRRYEKAAIKYSNAITNYLNGSQTDNSELKILKAQADKIYKTFTKEEITKHNISPTSPLPTKTQVNNLKDYQTQYKKYELLRNSKPHYINKSKAEQKQMDDLFSYLGGVYFRMSKENKAKVKRPIAPILPYAKITLNGKTYYKKRSELTKEEKATLPPPPPPALKKSKGGPNYEDIQEVYNPSFLEYIIEMEELGASFYLDNEKISAEEAKAIAQNNKGKCTEMTTQTDDDGNYLVKLSSSENNNVYARSIDLKILNDNSYLIDGIKATKKSFVKVFNQLHQDITPEVRNKIMNIHISSSKEISDKETWFIYNSLKDYGFYRIVTPNQEINRAKGNTPFAINSNSSAQQQVTKKEVAAYNAWAKKMKAKFEKMPESEKINGYPHMINDETFRYYNSIYDRMTSEQKKKSEYLPEAVLVTEWPMPVATSIEPISQSKQERATKKQIAEYNAWAKKINAAVKKAKASKSYEYPIIKKKEVERYLHIYKNLMTEEQRKNAEPLPNIPPPPPPAPEEPKLRVKEVKEVEPPSPPKPVKITVKNKDRKVVKVEEVEVPRVEVIEVPPPPPPPVPLDFVVKMAKANAKFFNEGQPISSDKAIELLKKNPDLNIRSQKSDTGQVFVYISKKPIVIEVKEKSRN